MKPGRRKRIHRLWARDGLVLFPVILKLVATAGIAVRLGGGFCKRLCEGVQGHMETQGPEPAAEDSGYLYGPLGSC